MFNKSRLLTPGPTPLPERVRLALAVDMIHHRKAPFAAVMEEIQQGLKALFGTDQAVLPLSCSGTGAMTAAVHGLFATGEKVIVIDGGKFGQRWAEIATIRGLNVVRFPVKWGEVVDPVLLDACLQEHPDAKGVLVQLSETSTGALYPIEELGKLTYKRNTLLVVDGISGVGISPCPMDSWHIDCLITGSQKGLMLPPGLALISLSERAWKCAEDIAPSCFYFNLIGERKQLEKGQTLFTSPVNLLLGLRESLRMFFESENGFVDYRSCLQKIYQKQWALTSLVRAGVKALSLELFAKDHYTWGLTSILMPAGVDVTALINIAEKDCGVIFANGQDHLKGKVVRLAHMGWVDWGDMLAALHALAYALHDVGGYSASRDYLEKAMLAYHDALQNPLP